MIIPKTNVSALLNGPPRNGPIGYLLGQAVRTTNNYSYEWWEFPMPLTRLIRPCHPKNLSVNHLYPIEFKPLTMTSSSLINYHPALTPATEG